MPKNSPLSGRGLLTPLQRSFLTLFSRLADKDQFYLTGGTALAEYFLGHRLSFDLDLFTGSEGLVLPVSYQVEEAGKTGNLEISVVRRFASYVEFMVTDHQDRLKVDLALDSPFRFEPPAACADGILVNDYQDLRVDKLLAFYGRAEPRDAVDVYFILQKEPPEQLLQQAAQKDPGFDRYWLAVALNRCAAFPDEPERWPVKMLVPFDPVKIKAYFQELAAQIMGSLKK